MIAEKLIWTSQDTFKTMHDKIESLVGKEVYCNLIEEKKVTIFSVSEIDPFTTGFWNGIEFVETKSWGFSVSYGYLNRKSGMMFSWNYFFSIPRKSEVFADDLKQNSIVYDPKHPFIFYQINTKITS